MSESKALSIPAGGRLAAITPTSFDDVARMAKLCVMAGMFPSKDEAGESKSIAQATMAIMQGLECGIPPMQAVQQIAVINGRCTIWGDLVPAMIWSNGHEIEEWIEGDGDDRVAHCKIKRGDNGKEVERTFSVKQAKKAGLWDTRETVERWNKFDKKKENKPNDNPWFKYDERMLQMRARGFCSRDAVPDVLRGMYLREEVEEEREVRDITPHVAPEPPAPPAPPMPPEPPAIIDQTPPEFNVPAFMANLEDELCACQDTEALGECWTHSEATMEDHLDRNQRDAALDIYKRHEARLIEPVSDLKAAASA
jgi:hypothetical protein